MEAATLHWAGIVEDSNRGGHLGLHAVGNASRLFAVMKYATTETVVLGFAENQLQGLRRERAMIGKRAVR